MGIYRYMDIGARKLALRIIVVFLGGTLIGSLLPESGNIMAYYLRLPYESGHFFNPCFLIVGIIGIMLACAFGYKKGV